MRITCLLNREREIRGCLNSTFFYWFSCYLLVNILVLLTLEFITPQNLTNQTSVFENGITAKGFGIKPLLC
jgi:hypothetical protein